MKRFFVCAAIASALVAGGGYVPFSSSEANDGAAAADTTAVPSARSAKSDAGADGLDEMIRGAKGRPERWRRRPELVVLMSVMQYEAGSRKRYAATDERLTSADAYELVEDLTSALGVLTGGAFTSFATVRRETLLPGATTHVVRSGQIVVGRYRGVRSLARHIGRGGRSASPDGTIVGGFVVLDDEFDRTSNKRRLLRAHELGHALGYNHVESRASIMNPRIGSEPTAFDRRVAAIAFGRRPHAAEPTVAP